MKRSASGIIVWVALLTVVIVAGFLLQGYRPSFEEGRYRLSESATWEPFDYPLRIWESESPTGDFETTMILGYFHPTDYLWSGTGELLNLTVNGIDVTPPRGERLIDLAYVVHAGANTVTGTIQKGSPPHEYLLFDLSINNQTKFVLYAWIALGLLGGFVAWQLARSTPLLGGDTTLIMLAAAGTFLRVLYVITTPFWRFSYDIAGHQFYVKYFLDHWTMPPSQLGWETYQPPLFYFLAALWLKCTDIFSMGFDAVQILTLLMSIATLFTGLWIATLLWPSAPRLGLEEKPEERYARLAFGSIIATFPWLIMLSSQLTNDTLYTLLAFLLVGYLLRWNAKPKNSDWYILIIVTALGLLTKSTILLLLPVIAGTLLLRPKVSVVQKLWLTCASAIGLAVISGWFFVLRFLIEGEQSIVGNIDRLHAILAVPNGLTYFVTFNPLQVFLHPFLNDVNATNRQAYLLEYIIRSAHFGYRTVDPMLAQLVLLAAMTFLVVALIGYCKTWRDKHAVPLILTVLCCAIGIVAYRGLHPFNATQHFRFIVPALIPLAAYAAQTVRKKERHWHVALAVLMTYAVLCILVLMSFCMEL